LLHQVKHAKNNEEALDLLFEAMARLEDPNKRAAFAAAAFGKSGLKMANMVRGGTKEIALLRAEYRRLAGDQQKFADNAGNMDDALDSLNVSYQGARNALLAELLPALTSLVKMLTEFIAKNRESIAEWGRDFAKELPARIAALVDAFKTFAEVMKPIAWLVMSITKLLGGLNGVAVVLAVVISGKLLLAIYSLGSAIVALGAAILATPVGWLLAAVAAIGFAVYTIYKNWEPIKGFFRDLWSDVLGSFQGNIGSITNLVKAFVKVTLYPFIKTLETLHSIMPDSLRNSGPGRAVGDALAWINNRDQPSSRADLAAPPAPGSVNKSQAQVTVDFKNMPRGARVTADPSSTADLDFSQGYMMGQAY
jgi:phage-related minor tail protein